MITVFYMVAMVCIGASFTAVWTVNRDNKRLANEVKQLERINELYIGQCKSLRDELIKSTPQEQIPQAAARLEEEVDDITYNRIIQEWIYGADEDKEGGIDGE